MSLPSITAFARGAASRSLLAMLVLVVQLLAPILPMAAHAAATDAATLIEGAVICHAGGDAAQAADRAAPGEQPSGHPHACLLCPACHFASAAFLQPNPPPPPPRPSVVATRLAEATPPATGPPDRPRTAARPRAPPARSV
jgi:hypothetical protein